MNLVKLRVVTAFNIYRVGDIIERLPSVAKTLLKANWYGRKLVEEVPAPAVVPVQMPVMVSEPLPTEEKTEPPRFTPKHKKRG